jgi:hypothetical protein
VSQLGSSSVEVRVSGSGFRPGTVFLSATAEGRAVSVQPIVIHTNRAGFFSQLVRINLPYQAGRGFVLGPNWMYSRQITLHAFGQGGQASTQVILSSWPFQYGLVR